MNVLGWAVRVSALALAATPSCRAEPAPFPQAGVVVDTDLPVPQLASRLRVDIFDGRGAWRSSRDFTLRSGSDFPVSFSVFLPDEHATDDVLVRLRLRPDAAERDYRGERYRPAPAPDAAPDSVTAVPVGDGQPRLLVNGEDRTPTSEPLPDLTVDRLVRIKLVPGTASTVRVLLRGECMGRMANLAERTACVDRAHLLDDAGSGDEIAEGEGRLTSAGGLLRGQALDPPEPPASAIPIRGGAFILGGDDLRVGVPAAQFAPSFPPRAAIMSGLAIDREEVSVGRLRAFLAGGGGAGAPVVNAGPLATSSADPRASCTYRETPDPSDPERDLLPVTCVPFETARAFCRHEGGDLPTEAQWEYVAVAAGRLHKTRYPWGNDTPSCEGVVFARFDRAAGGATGCHDRGFPFGLRGAGRVTVDASADGVRGLAGAASEWVLGAPFAYDSACYQRANLADPLCDAKAPDRTARGGSWSSSETVLAAAFRARIPVGGSTPTIGFRCAYGR